MEQTIQLLEQSKNQEIQSKNQEIEKLKKENDEKFNQMRNEMKNEIETLKFAFNSAGGMVKTSLNAIAYLSKNYDKAPVIERITDCDKIKKNQDISKFGGDIIYHYKYDSLDSYISDFIVGNYKKENAEDQSVWTTDISRLTYMIRETIKKKPTWVVDKKGVSTMEYIVDPLMIYLKKSVNEYYKELRKMEDSDFKIEYMNLCVEIKNDFDNKTIHKNVLRCIAPKLFLQKE